MSQSDEKIRTLIQCDFDGTVTLEDVSFHLLDTFADGDWRQVLAEYLAGRISVGSFNTRAFAMIKADEPTLRDSLKGKIGIRAGFDDLLAYCRQRSFRFVIVSNGLEFYIKNILRDLGVADIEVLAARAEFKPAGLEVKYIGPDGNQLEDGFKEAYTEMFLKDGYRIVYIGNGVSDSLPARRAHYIFATGDLLDHCRQIKLSHTPFDDFKEVVRGLARLK